MDGNTEAWLMLRRVAESGLIDGAINLRADVRALLKKDPTPLSLIYTERRLAIMAAEALLFVTPKPGALSREERRAAVIAALSATGAKVVRLMTEQQASVFNEMIAAELRPGE